MPRQPVSRRLIQRVGLIATTTIRSRALADLTWDEQFLAV